VVVVKPSATQCGYEQFLQELEQLLINTEVMDGH
jgi:ribonuclease P protein component